MTREIKRYNPRQIGALIRHMRTTADLSQGDLGLKLGFDRGSISNMERGRHTVSLADLMKAADICGFKLRLLVDRLDG